MKKVNLICLLMIGLVSVSNFLHSAKTPTDLELSGYEPMIITMKPQNSDMIYSNTNISFRIKSNGNHFGFEIFYMDNSQKIMLVEYFNQQLTMESQATKAAELVIGKIKSDKPLEIKGEELNSIFN